MKSPVGGSFRRAFGATLALLPALVALAGCSADTPQAASVPTPVEQAPAPPAQPLPPEPEDGPTVAPAMRLPENTGTVRASNWLAHAAMDASSVQLEWSSVEDTDMYRLYRQPTALVDYTALSAGDLSNTTLVYEGQDLRYVDTDVESGIFLTYALVAHVGTDATEPRWTEALTITDNEPPSAITGLTATSTEAGVLLEWDQSRDNVEFASYSVSLVGDDDQLRYIGGGADESLTSFLDTDTTPGTRTYEVAAHDFHDNRSEAARIDVTY